MRPSTVDELTNQVVDIVFGGGGAKGQTWMTLWSYSSSNTASLTGPTTNVSVDGPIGPKENDS